MVPAKVKVGTPASPPVENRRALSEHTSSDGPK
jgi:hypothetical protein